MDGFVKALENANSTINGIVWGPVMLFFFLAIGLMFTIRTRFFQATKFKMWLEATFLAVFKNKSVVKTDDKHSISQFQSLCTALAATIGTGNIAGVATAIASGGPGAVFWMWLSAILGTMTNHAENVLGIKYRYK
ncbi:MAG: alanine:cation symporter family protein, partial [Clostridiales bacterium]|nr:alanine:cation symporter family protein [Clostridiales bacterium]